MKEKSLLLAFTCERPWGNFLNWKSSTYHNSSLILERKQTGSEWKEELAMEQYLQEPVDGDNHCYVLRWQADRREDHDHGDQAGRGHGRGAKGGRGGGERNDDQVGKAEDHSVHLADEDGRDGLVQGRAVHVDCCADGQHEAGDPGVALDVLLETLEGDREGGGGGAGADGEHDALGALAHEGERVLAGCDGVHGRDADEAVQDEANNHGHHVHAKPGHGLAHVLDD